jgi:hypothetical protein
MGDKVADSIKHKPGKGRRRKKALNVSTNSDAAATATASTTATATATASATAVQTVAERSSDTLTPSIPRVKLFAADATSSSTLSIKSGASTHHDLYLQMPHLATHVKSKTSSL